MSDSLFLYRERAKQLVDFSGLLDGTCYPTDIDGLIEWKGKAFIFIEVKGAGKEMPFGQNLAFERLSDDLNKIKPTLVLVVEHNIQNPEEDIPLRDTRVKKYRWRNQWRFPPEPFTTKEMIVTFITGIEQGTIKAVKNETKLLPETPGDSYSDFAI